MAKKNRSGMPNAKLSDKTADLRRMAEEILLKRPGALDSIPPVDVGSVLHELRVHQIELEMQNDQLCHAQQELEASREKYFDLYDLAPVGYVTLNEKGIILEANLTAAALLRKKRSHLMGQPITLFIIREDQDIYYHHCKQLFETRQHQECEVRMLKGDGARLWARMESVSAKGNDGGPAFRTAIIDITRRRQAEEELDRHREHLEDRVKERTVELTVANEELKAFNYTVSHDLRAPLRQMRGFLELLQKRIEDKLDEKSRQYASMISESSKKMDRLINDLLSYSRLGRKEMHKRDVNLSHLLKEAVDQITDETKGREIVWKLGELPVIYGEPLLLKLVLVNLISNAVKFTSTRPCAEIEIGCGNDGRENVCFVKDNGVGFNMDYVDKLFGVFQRLHTQEEFEGTGIGLANVRRIISLHGGRTWAEGSPGQGATVYFTLPTPKDHIQ